MDRRQTMNFVKKHYTTSIIAVFILNGLAAIFIMISLYPEAVLKFGDYFKYVNYYIWVALIVALLFGFLGIFTLYQARIVKNKDLAELSAFAICYTLIIASLYVGKVTNDIMSFVSAVLLLLFAFFLVFKSLKIKAEFM